MSEIPRGACRPGSFPVGLSGVEGQGRQGVEGAAHVEQLRVGVHVHRQVQRRVPHGGLCNPRRHPAFAQVRAESVPQGVNVEGPAAVVALRDAGKAQVAVEDLHQLDGNGEQRGLGRQPGGDRGAGLAGFLLQPAQLVGEPVAQVRCEVGPEREVVALPALFVPRVQRQEGNRAVEVQLSHGHGSQLAPPKPGQQEGLVDQRPFPAQQLQPLPRGVAHLGDGLALPPAAADGQGVEQRPAAGRVEQPCQFGLVEGAARPAAVGFLIRPGDAGERVDGKPAVLDAPVGEGDGGGKVGVAGPARHPFGGALDKPALDGRRVEVRQPAETAVPG
ncbi:MAG TPA: hypothetical protein VFA26_24745 [Gemmataceae bacterium]|nr:hypothetical protein [Gemmataceae bacterium]